MKKQEKIIYSIIAITMTQTKSCLRCQVLFDITQADLDFYDKISPTFAWEKFLIPTPTLCPDCRQRRRLSFRNERRLYKRKCDASGKDIISIYVPGSDYIVYDQKIWWSDDRDPMKYGRDFDFTKSFTEQFGELMRVVPRLSLINMNSENSDFCNPWLNNKNCYMVNSITNSEWCFYWRWVDTCDNCFDCYAIEQCQSCSYSIQLKNCFWCHFSSQLQDCSHCRHCVWLIGKQYCINNIQYSKESYFENIGSNFDIKPPIPELFVMWNEWCFDCSIIFDSNNCVHCDDVRQSSDLIYCQMVKPWCYDCIDCTLIIWSKLNKEVMSTSRVEKCIWGMSCRDGVNIFYCDNCYNCSDCFWCIWLRNKQYCIFNKQYTKEDYEILVWKIIRHMMQPRRDALSARPGESYTERWEFFHPSLSPFGYNETVAQEYFPLSVDHVGTRLDLSDNQQNTIALSDNNILSDDIDDGRGKPTSLQQIDYSQFGYHRSTYLAPTPQVDKVIKWSELPNTIDEITDDILKMAVLCEVSNKPFRITPQELVFYRKHHIPLPRKHPDVRHEERMKLRR